MRKLLLALLALFVPALASAQGVSWKFEEPVFAFTNQTATFATPEMVPPAIARNLVVQLNTTAITGTAPTTLTNVQRWNESLGAWEEWAVDTTTHNTVAIFPFTVGTAVFTGLNQSETSANVPIPRRFRVQIIEGGTWTDLDGFIYVTYLP